MIKADKMQCSIWLKSSTVCIYLHIHIYVWVCIHWDEYWSKSYAICCTGEAGCSCSFPNKAVAIHGMFTACENCFHCDINMHKSSFAAKFSFSGPPGLMVMNKKTRINMEATRVEQFIYQMDTSLVPFNVASEISLKNDHVPSKN